MSDLIAACFRRDVNRDGWPSVSVVVPVRNEAANLRRAVASILAQEYPVPFDVCLVVSPSTDDTGAVAAELAAESPRLIVVSNPSQITPVALNIGIAATSGSIVVRVDGHSALSAGYIRRAVETMVRTGAVNVGGMQVPQPASGFERAVAAATTSWLGTGGATYRVGGAAGPVDTVFLGVFDRAAGDSVGWFDERLIRNQDYELNIRLRSARGTVWFDPGLSVAYRPRGAWQALASQYYEYGCWKARVAVLHPRSLRIRQLAPVIVVAGFAGGALASMWRPIAGAMPLALSAGWLVAAATLRGPNVRYAHVAAVLPTIHLAWGVGFLRGVLFRRDRLVAIPPGIAPDDHGGRDIVVFS